LTLFASSVWARRPTCPTGAADSTEGGLIPWARDAVDVLMRAQSDSATKQIRHFLGRDRVLRVNSTVPTGLVKLDSVDADSLIGRAGHESRVTSPEFTRCFADHTAPLYIPHSPKEK